VVTFIQTMNNLGEPLDLFASLKVISQ
jgi:hypothetical protein